MSSQTNGILLIVVGIIVMLIGPDILGQSMELGIILGAVFFLLGIMALAGKPVEKKENAERFFTHEKKETIEETDHALDSNNTMKKSVHFIEKIEREIEEKKA